MAEKLLAGAMSAATTAAGMARHVIWYFSYQVDSHANARIDNGAGRLSRRVE